MSESSRINAMLRNPRAMLEYQLTGRLPPLPERQKPSPLALLLLSLTPRELLAIRNLKIGPALGYVGLRTFANGAQALNWVYPKHSSSQYTPADSSRDRRFEQAGRSVKIDDLLAHCSPPAPGSIRKPR